MLLPAIDRRNSHSRRVQISHDRWFIDRLATHILSFEGDSKVVFYEGNFSSYEAAKIAEFGEVAPKRPSFKSLI